MKTSFVDFVCFPGRGETNQSCWVRWGLRLNPRSALQSQTEAGQGSQENLCKIFCQIVILKSESRILAHLC